MASVGLILCCDGGSTYIPMVEDVQKVATGLFITAEVLTVLECYGLKIFYGDIHSLMGNPSDSQWSHAYTWSFWKWRWRMAPAFSIFHVLTSFFRQYPSPENDPDYNYYYDFILFFLVFLVIIIPLIFGYRSYSKIVRYLAKYEKNKKFDKKMLWSCQRNMRSWNRIVENMSEKDKKFAKNCLPEREPYDQDGYWKSVYLSIETPDRTKILEWELDRTDVKDFQIEEMEIGEESDEEYNSEDEQLEELLNSEFSKSIESFEEATATVEPLTVTFETYNDLWFPNDDKENDHKKQKNLDHYSY
ncbi:hypothetical protein L3Y34_004370 [Caenorhabditis briggsae]|uniref:Uncharacterized protein n=1 Tax=Caenorhabditis briggsae TaxID=6238 RepID=A0AAE9AFI7_CAEBR|nr:hypothetical protein L3Y34_004370 [Caenorhabditis briggsae]